MRQLYSSLRYLSLTLIAPFTVFAQTDPAVEEAARFVALFNNIILFPVITLLLGIALLVFVYGSAVYLMNADNEQARDQGKKHIIYGILGMLVMVSAYTILSIAAGTFGLTVPR